MDEITAPYAVADLVSTIELRTKPVVTVGAKTDMGRVRENNEDKHEYFLPEEDHILASRGHVFVVCDGMGGHEAGQIASELATKTFIESYLNHPAEDPEAAGVSATLTANRFIFDTARAVPARRGMGTTLSALCFVQEKAFIFQVGDSRVYRLRSGELEQITVDHTWVEEIVRSGQLTRSEAEVHPNRHILTQAVGTQPQIRVDTFALDLEVGDQFLVCSDGLTNHVKDEALARTLGENGPSKAAWMLVAMALADGGSDNATAIVIRVDDLLALTDPSPSIYPD
ncbi:MAG: Stp1/IreP family PP2C-type Ser/Thr phosphatase [Fimbriimonadaceae bacterium]|jgi:protein phosphatase|nr:Stp1/IreP family PP2C-type Ser/Thr phosphatase [Fimbriimonadaceae bacterium]